ncbi:uncharacterized protein [Clytia hemisphaerica]
MWEDPKKFLKKKNPQQGVRRYRRASENPMEALQIVLKQYRNSPPQSEADGHNLSNNEQSPESSPQRQASNNGSNLDQSDAPQQNMPNPNQLAKCLQDLTNESAGIHSNDECQMIEVLPSGQPRLTILEDVSSIRTRHNMGLGPLMLIEQMRNTCKASTDIVRPSLRRSRLKATDKSFLRPLEEGAEKGKPLRHKKGDVPWGVRMRRWRPCDDGVSQDERSMELLEHVEEDKFYKMTGSSKSVENTNSHTHSVFQTDEDTFSMPPKDQKIEDSPSPPRGEQTPSMVLDTEGVHQTVSEQELCIGDSLLGAVGYDRPKLDTSSQAIEGRSELFKGDSPSANIKVASFGDINTSPEVHTQRFSAPVLNTVRYDDILSPEVFEKHNKDVKLKRKQSKTKATRANMSASKESFKKKLPSDMFIAHKDETESAVSLTWHSGRSSSGNLTLSNKSLKISAIEAEKQSIFEGIKSRGLYAAYQACMSEFEFEMDKEVDQGQANGTEEPETERERGPVITYDLENEVEEEEGEYVVSRWVRSEDAVTEQLIIPDTHWVRNEDCTETQTSEVPVVNEVEDIQIVNQEQERSIDESKRESCSIALYNERLTKIMKAITKVHQEQCGHFTELDCEHRVGMSPINDVINENRRSTVMSRVSAFIQRRTKLRRMRNRVKRVWKAIKKPAVWCIGGRKTNTNHNVAAQVFQVEFVDDDQM